MKIRALFSAGLLVLAAASVQAQQNDAAPAANAPNLKEKLVAPVSAPVQVAPRLTAEEQAKLAAPARTANQPALQSRGRSVAYMIAGGALFVAGLLIDDNDAGTVLMLGGAVIGAYGLYLHFR